MCASDKPLASPLARWPVQQSDVVSTFHHKSLKLGNSIHRGLLALLDGSRDRTALRTDLMQIFESGKLNLSMETVSGLAT